MASPTLSIVIPTHKRPEILRECLRRIDAQTIRDQLEVIVVSDGHDDATNEMIKKLESASPQARLKYFEIPKSQQGVARNKGVSEATGERVLFIGDDIFLEPDACEKHLHDDLVLGFTTWDPAVGITPVMQWLEKSGWQFGYPMITQFSHQMVPRNIQHKFTYTSHISLPTNIAKKFPFREDVRLYGWEDIEWGMRLAKAGVKMFYEPDAKALHHHHMTLEQSLRRMETLGISAKEIEKIAPELNVVPKGWKRTAYEVASWLPTMSGTHRRAFLRGMEPNITSV